jgi:hypothetical protein
VVPFFNGREKGVHVEMADDTHAVSLRSDEARV